MSVPLLLLMVSNHYPTIYGGGGWISVVGFVVAGFLLTWFLYKKSGSAAPTKY
jgi:uncharacterized membrane protein